MNPYLLDTTPYHYDQIYCTMARRLSDATFQSVCNLCTGVVGRALGISGENDGNEQANPRGFREAVYDGLCATCTNACSTAFSRLAQHQTSNQPEIVLANIDEGVEEAPVPTRAQIRAQQMDRILAHLHVTSPSPQVSFDGVEQESDSVLSPVHRDLFNFRLGEMRRSLLSQLS